MLKLSVVGTGYLGATHAAAMSSLGFQVIGLDVDAQKIEMLKQGKVPFYEPDLEELLEAEVKSGRLTFTTDFSAIADCDVHFICVGTPQMKDSLAADLSYVDASIKDVAPHAKPGSLVVGKSTVPVGTADRLAAILKEINPSIELAWNPEFLREGFAVEDTLRPNRLVVGVTSNRAEEILKEVYAPLIANNVPWIRADLPTAELVKVAANSFLATKISFINAMAEIGIGFGGGCLPKDIRAFMARSEELGARQSLEFLREIDSINQRARQRMIDLVRIDIGQDLKGKKIAVLGAAFKPDSDDVRDSPALDIAVQLAAAGADVNVHDPKAIEAARRRFPQLTYSTSIDDCLSGSDVLLHLTEWKIYREIDPVTTKSKVRQAIVIDGRNALDRERWISAGWKFRALGRS